MLGVVENMSGLQQSVDTVRFLSVSDDASQKPADVTAAVLEALRHVAPDLGSLMVQSDVFRATKGGAESMATNMGVPFLGRVPLDPALSLAGKHVCIPCFCRILSQGQQCMLACMTCCCSPLSEMALYRTLCAHVKVVVQRQSEEMCGWVQVRRADLPLMRRRAPCQAELHSKASLTRS